MEKVENLTKAADEVEKSILRAFARTRAKKSQSLTEQGSLIKAGREGSRFYLKSVNI